MIALLFALAAAPFIQLHVTPDAQACLVHLHGDEVRARSALLEFRATHKVNTLHFSVDSAGKQPLSTRTIRIAPGCDADPNRVFTQAGWKQPCVRRWARDTLLPSVEQCRASDLPVIAFHNNRAFTLATFDGVAARRHRHRDDGNLVLVTREADFAALSALDAFDVVLQSSAPPDDGSLSVLLRDARYFNVETRRDSPSSSRALGLEVLALLSVQRR